MATLRERYIALKQEIAGIEAAWEFDAHSENTALDPPASLLDRKQTAARFGISISKFDQDRKPDKDGSRKIYLDPVSGMGRRV